MGNILDKIVATKKVEVDSAKERYPLNYLLKQIETTNVNQASLVEALKIKPGIIAEFKRASPSKGIINATSSVADIVTGYDKCGAVGISVLTDKYYFKAVEEDFRIARTSTTKPILRKEFIIDEYQIYQSKAMGANVILLIAAILSKEKIKSFTLTANSIGLEVLLELHDLSEIEKLSGSEDLIGINNRNLKTFEVDINQSIYIKNELGGTGLVPFIAESGLSSIKEISVLLNEGFSGFLLGEFFMKQENPVQAFATLNKQLIELS